MRRSSCLAAAALLGASLAGPAFEPAPGSASAPPNLRLSLDRREVRLGDPWTLRIELRANSRVPVCAGRMPSFELWVRPEGRRPPASFRLGGPAPGRALEACEVPLRWLRPGERLSWEVRGRLAPGKAPGALRVDFGRHGSEEVSRAPHYEVSLAFNPAVADPVEFGRLGAVSRACRLRLAG